MTLISRSLFSLALSSQYYAVALIPSAVFDPKSNIPAIGFANIPNDPFSTPRAPPETPLSL